MRASMRSLSGRVLALIFVFGAIGPAARIHAQPAQTPAPTPGTTSKPTPGGIVPGVQRPSTRPPRDPREAAAARPGAAAIRGRVVDAVTGQPVARARIRMGGPVPRTLQTDADGTFAFTSLPSGMIQLSAQKAGYNHANFPERMRTLRGNRVMLADGQVMEDVTIQLWRGGVIAGRVLDQYGDPLEAASVSLLRLPASGKVGGRTQTVGGTTVNDIGEFRLARLEPGSYLLIGQPQRHGFPGEDTDGPTAPGRTFYPGVAAADQAVPITLEKGQSVTGLDLTLLETTMTRVAGTVIGANGEPVSAGNVRVRGRSAAGNMFWSDSGAMIKPDGTFELKLQAGDYTVEAMPRPNRMPGAPPPSFDQHERGLLNVSVGGEAISNLVITVGAGGKASGRFVFDARKAPPSSLQNARVWLRGLGETGDRCEARGQPTVNPDGTFLAENVFGPCQVQSTGIPGWQVKAVLHRGTDITSRAIEFQPGQHVSDLQIVLTDKVGDLSFEVADEHGTPVPEYVAILFPVDKAMWTDPRHVRSQVISIGGGAPGAAGSFAFGRGEVGQFQSTFSFGVNGPAGGMVVGGVPMSAMRSLKSLLPGEYFAIAVDDVGYESLRDPEFLAQIAVQATRVSIAEGESKSVPLRRVTLPDDER